MDTKKEQGIVSIVVPVYNAQQYIEKTIQMVQTQTYDSWELYLVDDCSKDQSVEIIKKYLSDERIHLICQEKNKGAAVARNIGIEQMQGDYLAFLDADDVWKPDKLEKQLQFMKEKKAHFVYSGYEFGDEQANPTGKVVHVKEQLTYREALSRTIIFTSTVLLDMHHFSKEDVKMPLCKSEDTATWWKILKKQEVAYGLDQVLVIYRRPQKSLSSNKVEAVKRIWALYRKQELLSVEKSAYYFIGWALRATLRRL